MSIRTILARKTVSISEETHSELTKLGVYGETIDDIIRKCIDAYKKEIKNKTNLDYDDSNDIQVAGPSYKK